MTPQTEEDMMEASQDPAAQHAAAQPPQEQQGGPVVQPGAQAQTVAPEGVQSQEGVGQQAPSPTEHVPAADQEPQEQPFADRPAVAGGESVPPGAEVPGADADRAPAAEQAPVAQEAQDAITGDPGFGEQNAVASEGSPSAVDRPVGTSMMPPSMQSGMPLPEDRQAAESEQQQEADKQEAEAK